MNLSWFVRMARWVRNPPSMRQVQMVGGIVLLCFALVAIERLVGWPDWLTTQGGGQRLRP